MGKRVCNWCLPQQRFQRIIRWLPNNCGSSAGLVLGLQTDKGASGVWLSQSHDISRDIYATNAMSRGWILPIWFPSISDAQGKILLMVDRQTHTHNCLILEVLSSDGRSCRIPERCCW
jgi:hypothetical protein